MRQRPVRVVSVLHSRHRHVSGIALVNREHQRGGHVSFSVCRIEPVLVVSESDESWLLEQTEHSVDDSVSEVFALVSRRKFRRHFVLLDMASYEDFERNDRVHERILELVEVHPVLIVLLVFLELQEQCRRISELLREHRIVPEPVFGVRDSCLHVS